MKKGTKSLLWGVHQVFIHPVIVWLAWIKVNKSVPSWKEVICIIIHDWGYWGCENMDDEKGERHTEWAADIALFRLDSVELYYLCLFHSRHYARKHGAPPSKLCWADKYSITYEPWWLYLPRAWASGELKEYRQEAADAGFLPLSATHREWFAWVSERLAMLGREKRGDCTPYVNPVRIIEP